VSEADVSKLLAAYDAQLRGVPPERVPAGVTVELDGPLVRFLGRPRRGFVEYRDLAGLEGDELDALIERQVEVFARRGESFEWKLHGHDLPPDLPERLRAAGFVPEDQETVLIAEVAAIAAEPELAEGVTLREVTERSDLDRIEALEEVVWSGEGNSLADMLESELELDPEALTVVAAEAGGEAVCAGWVRFEPDSSFATFWGGATLPAWRRRGVYRALVAYRAKLAARRGFRHIEVDASDNSRPILERLGFVPVTTTTPYIWSP
jgi:GNAT superfamily N-acetyltransferase